MIWLMMMLTITQRPPCITAIYYGVQGQKKQEKALYVQCAARTWSKKKNTTVIPMLKWWIKPRLVRKMRPAMWNTSWKLKYGFCKKSHRKNETLTSWTLLAHFFSRSALNLCWSGKKVSQKCSTGQSFIFPKWLLTNSIL